MVDGMCDNRWEKCQPSNSILRNKLMDVTNIVRTMRLIELSDGISEDTDKQLLNKSIEHGKAPFKEKLERKKSTWRRKIPL